MLIGYPGDIRQIRDPARGLRLATADNVVQHYGMSGALRTTSRRFTPRKWSVNWAELSEVDAALLRSYVRRDRGPGPVVWIDSLTKNFQRPSQSLGLGRTTQWSIISGTLAEQTDKSILWSGGAAAAVMRWVHPVWTMWPVANGLTFSFRHTATGHQAAIGFYSATGALLTTITGAATYATGPAPATAAWAIPYLIKAGAGTLTIPRACVRYGDEIGASWLEGEHVAAMSLATATDTINHVPVRDVSLELEEF